MLGSSWGVDLLHLQWPPPVFTQHHGRKMGACDWLLPLCFHHQIPVNRLSTEHGTTGPGTPAEPKTSRRTSEGRPADETRLEPD